MKARNRWLTGALAVCTLVLASCAAPKIKPQFDMRTDPLTGKPAAYLKVISIPFRTTDGRAMKPRPTTEEIYVPLTTRVVGGTRVYILTPDSGLMQGTEYVVTSSAGAGSWLKTYSTDEHFEIDTDDPTTFAQWADDNWMTPNDYHATYGN